MFLLFSRYLHRKIMLKSKSMLSFKWKYPFWGNITWIQKRGLTKCTSYPLCGPKASEKASWPTKFVRIFTKLVLYVRVHAQLFILNSLKNQPQFCQKSKFVPEDVVVFETFGCGLHLFIILIVKLSLCKHYFTNFSLLKFVHYTMVQ